MARLIKKHSLGNVIDNIDAKLDSLGTKGRLAADLLDETGKMVIVIKMGNYKIF